MNTLLTVSLTILFGMPILFALQRLPDRFVGGARQWFEILNSPRGFVTGVLTLAGRLLGLQLTGVFRR
jgi:hypothetical protein